MSNVSAVVDGRSGRPGAGCEVQERGGAGGAAAAQLQEGGRGQHGATAGAGV